MKRFAVAVAAVALAAAGCGGTRTVTKTVTVATGTKNGPAAPRRITQFGYVKALTRKGRMFELRFDPAWLLSGRTASQAKLEDTGSSDVPNDFYLLDEGHRQLTYLVPPSAHVTVLTDVNGTPITVSQLAQLVHGQNPLHRRLFEPLTTGFWIMVSNDTVSSLDQQYFP